MTAVLDASALLAALLDEPGKERVDAEIGGALMSTVNLAEVVGHFAKAGARREDVIEVLAGVPLTYIAPDEALAVEAGMMRAAGEAYGLSLGDRICLALAKQVRGTALTADRAWRDIGPQIGVDVEVIR
jgi:ribonuclease VapC